MPIILESKSHNSNQNIAVVGMGCRYPGAKTPLELWQNILAQRVQFREMPACRLPLKDYYSSDKNMPDMTYGNRAAVLDNFNFNWSERRIPKTTFEATDMAHWLALDTTLDMLNDTAHGIASIPKEKTAVIIGNTLTGEFTRAGTMRLRWPYVKKILHKTAQECGITENELENLKQKMEIYFKSVFPPTTEDSLAGGLSNTIAGRICNYLDLNGGGYTVDGACSSSLIAIYTAANQLASGEIDFAIAGGVDLSLDPFELIGFAKTGALTKDEMRVYDQRGSGFIPGEGCGIVGLKRLDDAQRDGDKIYAVLKGWGISSDGKGGITAPSAKGQSTALRRAFDRAKLNSQELDFIEGHGTGTAVGDRTELLGIAKALGVDSNQLRSCGVTSFKSLVGHTKAAAGVGAFIKTVIAVNQRVLPPTCGCDIPHLEFSSSASAIYPIRFGKVLSKEKLLNAGVSAMGFGGINSHLVVESGSVAYPHLQGTLSVEALLASKQSSEVFIFSSKNLVDLLEEINKLIPIVRQASYAELTDMAGYLAEQQYQKQANEDWQISIRAAVTGSTPFQFHDRLAGLAKIIEEHISLNKNEIKKMSFEDGIWISDSQTKVRLGFVFPGQGSQKTNIARALVARHQWAKDTLKFASACFARAGEERVIDTLFPDQNKAVTNDERNSLEKLLTATEIAQPALVLSSVLWMKFLAILGVHPDIVTGHSLGELTAFHAAGCFDEEALFSLAVMRGKQMALKPDGINGAMLSLGCDVEAANGLITKLDTGEQKNTVIANINGPRQTIVSGPIESIEKLAQYAEKQKIRAVLLPVSNAFHSPLVKTAAEYLADHAPIPKNISSLNCTLISSINGQEVDANISLKNHFSQQLIMPVNFIATTNVMSKKSDVIIEVGSGKVLSKLIGAITKEDHKCLPVCSEANSDEDLNNLMATLFVEGKKINWQEFYKNRLIKSFTPATELNFLINPCEKEIKTLSDYIPNNKSETNKLNISGLGIDEETMQKYLNHRSDFITNVIKADIASNAGINIDLYSNKFSKDLNNHNKNDVSFNKLVNKIIPNSPAKNNVNDIIVSVIAEKTGFEVESITENLSMINDLNLDSIKSGELIAQVALSLGISSQVDPVDYAALTVGEISRKMQTIIEYSDPLLKSGLNESIEFLTLQSESNALDVLISEISKKTGFEASSITTDLNLLNDLNLDSIKAGELIAVVASMLGVNSLIDPLDYINESVGNIADAMQASAPTEKSKNNQEVKADDKILAEIIKAVSLKTGFAIESITTNLNLIDDLNLDSIKAAEVIGSVINQFSFNKIVDPIDYVALNIGVIAKSLSESIQTQNTSQALSTVRSVELAVSNDWVRAFEVRKIIKPYSEIEVMQQGKSLDLYKGERLALLVLNEKPAFTKKLVTSYENIGMIVDIVSAREVNGISSDNYYDHLVVVLNENINEFNKKNIQRITEFLSDVTLMCKVHRKTFKTLSFLNVTPMDGAARKDFSSEVDYVTGFAASIHLESPHIKVRVIGVNEKLNSNYMVRYWSQENVLDESFNVSLFDNQSNRYLLQSHVVNLKTQIPRNISWSQKDVFLITGGAKGITSECCIALAGETGASMALVGSSAAPDVNDLSNEINITLQKLKSMGVKCNYYSCDVTDSSDVKSLINRIRNELGLITGFIHGAGINKPRRTDAVSPEEAFAEIAPKVLGGINILNELDSLSLKFLLGVTSIIGITGMPGNAWYAFSNAMLNQIFVQFGKKFSHIHVQQIAYSVWSEVGMGAKLGSLKGLAKMGIGSISPKEGVDKFLELITYKPESHQIIVTARLGGLDTWKSADLSLPVASRFVQDIRISHLGVELVSRTHLHIDTDLYLLDHNYRGSYLFPTVLGLEAMAQNVACVLGIQNFTSLLIENIQLRRPIVVNENGGTNIEIRVLVDEINTSDELLRCKAEIFSEQSGFSRAHFSAEFLLPTTQRTLLDSKTVNTFQVPTSDLGISPELDLYGDLLFQGKLFQKLERIHSMDFYGSVSSARYSLFPHAHYQFYSSNHSNSMILGDPSFRDVMLQSAQLSDKNIFLPIEIKSLQIINLQTRSENQFFIDSKVINRHADELTCAINAYDEGGQLAEKMIGYNLKRLEINEHAPEPEEFANPAVRDEKIFADALSLSAKKLEIDLPNVEFNYIPGISSSPKDIRHVEELPIFFNVVKKSLTKMDHIDDHIFNNLSNTMTVQWSDTGKPFITGIGDNIVNVSLSHDRSHCLCVSGKDPQGCDIESFGSRSNENWKAIVGNAQGGILADLQARGDSLDQAGTRIWAMMEAFIKAFNEKPNSFEILRYVDSAYLIKVSTENYQTLIMSFSVNFTRPKEKCVAILVSDASKNTRIKQLSTPKSKETLVSREDGAELLEEDVYAYMKYGPNQESQPSFRFRVTFKDTRSLSRGLSFPIFSNWMGKVRELSIIDISSSLVPDFVSGKWGMVTNSSNLNIVGSAKCLDLIEGRTWISKVYGRNNSTVDMHFDWIKINPDNSRERIAYSNMTTTWVGIKSHGVVEVEPLPAYLSNFFSDVGPKNGIEKYSNNTREVLPEKLTYLKFKGPILYAAPASPVIEPMLSERRFETSMEESNLVGNIYYAHYYEWQSRTMDRHFFSLAPEYFQGVGDLGEIFCIKNEINHLREAMPLDTIKVRMSLKELYENGFVLYFDFYSEDVKGKLNKLAYGVLHALWVNREPGLEEVVSSKLPDKILNGLLEKIVVHS